MAKYKILLVEDDLVWIDILEGKIQSALQRFSHSGHSVKTVSQFDEAYKTLKTEPWQLLITDIGLGDSQESQKMKGKILVALAHKKQIPAIAVSGTSNLTLSDLGNLYEKFDISSFFEKRNFAENGERFINKIQELLQEENTNVIKSTTNTISTNQIQSVISSVDIGIITIKEEEYNSVLTRLITPKIWDGDKIRYRLAKLENGKTVALTRCIEQGNLEAQAIAKNILDDLDPQWILVVGIAGGLPSQDFSLGDVIVSSHIYDLTLEEATTEGRTYDIQGGRLQERADRVIQDLPGLLKIELSNWHDSVAPRPPINLSNIQDLINGDQEWKDKVEKSLHSNFSSDRKPCAIAGKIAASDKLIKDYSILSQWKEVARKIMAVDMESAGVYRATRQYPISILAIRGISDIVGLKREEVWTKYACETAAAFALSLASSDALVIS
ncbi:MAG: hypothetical protein F6K14_03125 [Symploca sp. SIO2C1]|nr:hypothetical protein [Symploca sp. SIO2C1]